MGCILLVDQNENFRRLVIPFLLSRGRQAIGAGSISEAIPCVQDVIIDLILLDELTCMKEEARLGQALVSLAQSEGIPILLLHPSRSLAVAGKDVYLFSAQAADHLIKPFDIEELGQRVEALLASKLPSRAGPRQVVTVGLLTLDLKKFELKVGGKEVLLTPTQFNLLRCLMEHVGETVSIERLLVEVWKYPIGQGSPEVVRWHIKKLRDKLAQAGCPAHAIRTIPRRGYVIPD